MAAVIKLDYDKTLEEAEHRNAVMARLLEEHARRAFEISKAALLDLTDQLTPDTDPVATPELQRRMRRWLHDIPGISSFWLIDAHGRVVHTTIPENPQGYNFSDRAYFKAHQEGQDLYVSPMTLGRIDHKWFFSLSKRINDRDGNFRGMLIASIRTEFFVSTYDNLSLAPKDNIAIFRSDGMTVVRRLDWAGEQAPSNARSSLFTTHLPRSPVGTYRSVSPIDGIDRILAYRTVEGWPLVVVSGSEMDGVNAPWLYRSARNAAYCAAVLVVLGTLTWWSYRRVASEELTLSKNAVLLNEVHHRVKNNLTVVQSLLRLEANRAPAEAQQGYEDSIARVVAMGLVHHLLYDHQSFGGIQAAEYLRRLCDGLAGSAGSATITVEAEPVEIPLDSAVPMALIANEIITNAVKHGRKDGRSHIQVSLNKRGADIVLCIADDGPGYDAEVLDGKAGSLGTTLVRQLTRQLKGQAAFANHGGAVFTLAFPAEGAAAV